jgi:mono/diheme cytochrome c family protein
VSQRLRATLPVLCYNRKNATANPTHRKNLSRFLADAAPDRVHGQQLVTERCTACHAMDSNKTGRNDRTGSNAQVSGGEYQGRELINPEALTDVRFGADSGLTSGIARKVQIGDVAGLT